MLHALFALMQDAPPAEVPAVFRHVAESDALLIYGGPLLIGVGFAFFVRGFSFLERVGLLAIVSAACVATAFVLRFVLSADPTTTRAIVALSAGILAPILYWAMVALLWPRHARRDADGSTALAASGGGGGVKAMLMLALVQGLVGGVFAVVAAMVAKALEQAKITG